MAKTIPYELFEIAKDYGCNTINFVATTKEGDVFSLCSVDDKGEYNDIGLPILYSVNGSMIKKIDSDRAFEILLTIKD